MESDPGFQTALSEARKGASEGGVPIGAALVSREGKVMGQGRNMRVQNGSTILHAEMSALHATGRLPAREYAGGIMYTTLSPCEMCTGACLLHKISRVVIGENKNFVGGEKLLKEKGVEVIVLGSKECEELMGSFVKEHADLW